MVHGPFHIRINKWKTETMSMRYLRRTEDETRWNIIKNETWEDETQNVLKEWEEKQLSGHVTEYQG